LEHVTAFILQKILAEAKLTSSTEASLNSVPRPVELPPAFLNSERGNCSGNPHSRNPISSYAGGVADKQGEGKAS